MGRGGLGVGAELLRSSGLRYIPVSDTTCSGDFVYLIKANRYCGLIGSSTVTYLSTELDYFDWWLIGGKDKWWTNIIGLT